MNPTVSNSQPITQAMLGVSEGVLKAALAQWGEKPYRADQIAEWVYRHEARSFGDMSNLSRTLRTRLAQRFHLYEATTVAESVSSDGTRKLLLRWTDGETTECVLIPDGERRTACISVQVGCPVGCVFCASGLDGVRRDLTAAQIVEQAMRIRALCVADNARLSNVVVMGLGEPLANYDHTVTALGIINADWGMNIGARKITVSTVGLPGNMRRLADENMQITLALSLHAPTDELRAKIIPWAKRVGIDQLIEAAGYYFDHTGREITIEYVLLKGVNDSLVCADQLADICRTMRSNVNLIRYNPVARLAYERPSAEEARVFLMRLRARGVNAHLRPSRGIDIEGACGQLRRRWLDAEPGDRCGYKEGPVG